MSITTTFGYTNKTASTKPVTPVNLEVMSKYALTKDEPEEVVLSNSTTPTDQAELISYKCKLIPNVSTTQDVMYPASVKKGIQYVVKVEELASTKSDIDPTFRVDSPMVAYLTIRHPRNSYITDAMIGEVVTRLLGACQKTDGSWRFSDMMRQSLKPTVG